MSDELKVYVPMTDEEILRSLHIAIIVNLDKLPQLKGKGKVAPNRRETGVSAFAKGVAETFGHKVIIKKPGWTEQGFTTPKSVHGDGRLSEQTQARS